MSFAEPTLLYALGLLVPVLIAFLVRRRRRLVRVPSTMLWQMAALARAKNRRIQTLRRLVALLACLLAVAPLAAAPPRPARRTSGETVALVVDVSASMQAGGSKAPIVEARRSIERMLLGRGPRDRYLIVAAGASPRRLVGPTDSTPALDEAVRALEVERGPSDLGAAVELAASLVAGAEASRVVVLTDGQGPAAGAGRDLGVAITERRLEPPSRDNLGVVGFAMRPPKDARSDFEREAVITVASSSDRERSAVVSVLADGQTVTARTITLAPAGEAEVRLIVRAQASEIAARVSPADGVADAIAIDDSASLPAAIEPPRRALLVVPAGEPPPGAFFAEKALKAAGVPEVVHVAPEVAAEIKPGDVVVALDHALAQRPAAPALYLGTKDGALPVENLRELATPAETKLLSVDAKDALLRGVALDGVTIAKARAANVPGDARALVELDGGAVLLAGGAGRASWVYVGLDPEESDLVLRVAFPVLVANAMATLAGAADVAVAETAPRSEVKLAASDTAEARAWTAEPEPPWRLPASPAALLAIVAAALLALEALSYRKGWAA